MDIKEIQELLKSAFDEGIGEPVTDKPVDPYITVETGKIHAVCLFLRDEERLQFDYLSCLSGVDYDKDNLASVYHLYSFALNHKIVLKVIVPKSNPIVPSVYDIWAAAEWHERESYDLMGIVYENHPDLRRILLPEDWEGHPLRKDFKVPEFYNGMKIPY
ncbi:MAG: NADH-quinone oxidoreductase subunit C [Ignavibacteriae bacterium]|nr:NADH-quinone oxidoreductase subunit C [Ignavibacteriota bacterium]